MHITVRMKKLILLLYMKIAHHLRGKGLQQIPGVAILETFMRKTYKNEFTDEKGMLLIESQGNKMYVNVKDTGEVTHSLLVFGVYERYETRLFKKITKPGMTVVDIGANYGYYTLIAAKLVGNDGRVYAFEPELGNYDILVKNIEMNGYANVTPIRKAVSNKQGKVRLYVGKDSTGIHSFSEANVYMSSKIEANFVEVETVTLDDFFVNAIKNTKVDLIKIDAQGAEGLIIEGAGKILGDNNLKIFMEFDLYMLRNLETEPTELLHKLENYGFKIKLIDERNHCLTHAKVPEIIKRCKQKLQEEGRGDVNLLLER